MGASCRLDALLAWNGGGKTNYSEIVSEGGYTVTRFDAEEYINEKIVAVEDKATELKSGLKEELLEITKQLEHLIEEA